MEWNRRDHARKFLRATGRYVSDGQLIEGSMVFWGEWEPESRVIETFAEARNGGPRWLHDPYWKVPRHRASLQNTDPLVFGNRFLYSNCRQGSNGKLRELAPGSVVIFGSKALSEFVVDTVFVVGDESETYTRGETGRLQCDDWVRAVVFDPLSHSPKPGTDPFRLYRGRRYDDAPSGPFSFVPCLPDRLGSSGFARPPIRLDARWIQPNLAMGAKATAASKAQLEDLWGDIAGQVSRVGLAMGVHLNPPRLVDSAS